MRAKKVESMIAWFRRHKSGLLVDGGNYGYYNISTTLKPEEITRLVKYFNKMGCIKLLIIISGVNSLRPQRSFGGLPEWLRNDTPYRYIFHDDNTFVFVSSIHQEDPAVLTEEEKARLKEKCKSEKDYRLILSILNENHKDYEYSKKELLESAKGIAEEAEADLIIKEFDHGT